MWQEILLLGIWGLDSPPEKDQARPPLVCPFSAAASACLEEIPTGQQSWELRFEVVVISCPEGSLFLLDLNE